MLPPRLSFVVLIIPLFPHPLLCIAMCHAPPPPTRQLPNPICITYPVCATPPITSPLTYCPCVTSPCSHPPHTDGCGSAVSVKLRTTSLLLRLALPHPPTRPFAPLLCTSSPAFPPPRHLFPSPISFMSLLSVVNSAPSRADVLMNSIHSQLTFNPTSNISMHTFHIS